MVTDLKLSTDKNITVLYMFVLTDIFIMVFSNMGKEIQ